MKVRIEEYYYGFNIVVEERYFSFDEDDTREALVDVFKLLGHEVEYEELS